MDITYQLTSKIRWVNSQQVDNNRIIYNCLGTSSQYCHAAGPSRQLSAPP